FAFLSAYIFLHEDRDGILTVVFLNVGQGDAIFIEAPSGNQMLIDGGPGKSVLRELSKVMPFYDRSIDAVLATHADQDHVGGLPDVLRRYKVNYFFETGNPGPSSSYEELKAMIEKLKIERLEARRGMAVDLGDGVILEILFPDRDSTGMETNMSSIVARLVFGESVFLLTGDSPIAIERYLVSLENQGSPLRQNGQQRGPLILESDVLKAGHHGSKTSTSPEFVSAVSPKYGIISAGLDNRYGHPTAEVLETLTKASVQILRTDRNGRIIFKSDRIKLELKD
ncbi:MAG: ComEC/Rec2 family competence protein, partial [Patescibacteria group bacterium]